MMILLQLVSAVFVGVLLAAGLCPLAHAATIPVAELGANKFDLVLQYTGWASGGDGSAAYQRVTHAMAEKAILDGQDAGFTFFRVSVTGHAPVQFGSTQRNDLSLWQTDPQRYWTLVDSMFVDLDRAGIRLVPTFVWNVAQFPALADESVGTFIRDPQSRSRILLDKYVEDFIGRYKDRKTILFYELTNELNQLADLDLRGRCMDMKPTLTEMQCKVMTYFTTEEMVAFSRQMVSLIKRLDPIKSVSSGYGLPRQSAHHLELQPGFSPRGADWTEDTIGEFNENLSRTQAPFDIMSIHVYSGSNRVQHGRAVGHEYEIIGDVSAVAKAAHKQLFLGEFGDTAESPFMVHMVDVLAGNTVDYAAVWVWEFYQSAPNHSFNTEASRFNLEPGFTDNVINRLKTLQNAGRSRATDGIRTTPHVVLTWPLPCSRVDHPIDLSAVASVAGLRVPDHVDFLVDGAIVGTAKTPPFRAAFSPTLLGNKKAFVAARAVARDGTFATFGSHVLLNGDTESCAVAGD